MRTCWHPSLVAGELYPTDVRTTAHGLSAGVAKLGALWASVWFNYLASRKRFWLAAALNSVGIILTLLFTPEPLRVPLLELDRRYAYHTAGKVYHGASPRMAAAMLLQFAGPVAAAVLWLCPASRVCIHCHAPSTCSPVSQELMWVCSSNCRRGH